MTDSTEKEISEVYGQLLGLPNQARETREALDSDRPPKWQRPSHKGFGDGRGGRQGKEQKWTQQEWDSWGMSRSQNSLSQAVSGDELREVVALLTRLDTEAALRTDCSFLLYMDTQGMGMTAQLFKISQEWKEKKEAVPPQVKQSLRTRTTLLVSIMVTMRQKMEQELTPEMRPTLVKHGWITAVDPPSWAYLRWNPTTERQEVDNSRPPLPHSEALNALTKINELAGQDGLLHKFHATRKMASEYRSPVLPFLIMVSNRGSEAQSLHQSLIQICDNSCLRLVGARLRQERMKRQPLANLLSQAASNLLDHANPQMNAAADLKPKEAGKSSDPDSMRADMADLSFQTSVPSLGHSPRSAAVDAASPGVEVRDQAYLWQPIAMTVVGRDTCRLPIFQSGHYQCAMCSERQIFLSDDGVAAEDHETFLLSAPMSKDTVEQPTNPIEQFAFDCLRRQVVTYADFGILLNMLAQVLPQTKRTRERINMGVTSFAFQTGAYVFGGEAGAMTNVGTYPLLTRLLAATVNARCSGLPFSTVTLSSNLQTGLHKDSHNHPMLSNIVIPITRWEFGGALWIEDDSGNIMHEGMRGRTLDVTPPYVLFNAHRAHCTMPWVGNRCVLIAYHIRDGWRLSDDCLHRLRAMGFPIWTGHVTEDPYM
ncbi:unnamed protein product [Symbiodinium sp. CCMP2592]|nr:unnamed protein product [Symbiodinium sp. CCMP2592]